MSAQVESTSVDALVERARALSATGERRILGITGSPGAGKTTTSTAIARALGPRVCALVPMDGFHLSNATLVAWGRRERKGAWDTFDADGYVHLLGRLRGRHEDVVHAPDFDRDLDEAIAAAIAVPREVPLVLAEGNYLLGDRGGWPGVRPLLDESWYLDLDDRTRQERLVERHQRHGMEHEQAVAWTRGVDQGNAAVVASARGRADRIWSVTSAAATARDVAGAERP